MRAVISWAANTWASSSDRPSGSRPRWAMLSPQANSSSTPNIGRACRLALRSFCCSALAFWPAANWNTPSSRNNRPIGRSKAPPASTISSASRAPGPDQGDWRLMINKDLAMSCASETDQAVGILRRVVQLAEAGQFPRHADGYSFALIALGLFFVQDTTTQGGGD